jgi:hypothetical protein
MAPKLGTIVTVRGELALVKAGECVFTDDGGTVVFQTTSTKSNEKISQIAGLRLGTRIEVTGTIGFSPYRPAPTPLVSAVAEYHFIDSATATILRLPVER